YGQEGQGVELFQATSKGGAPREAQECSGHKPSAKQSAPLLDSRRSWKIGRDGRSSWRIVVLRQNLGRRQAVDLSALIWTQSQLDDPSPAPPASSPPFLFGGHRQL